LDRRFDRRSRDRAAISFEPRRDHVMAEAFLVHIPSAMRSSIPAAVAVLLSATACTEPPDAVMDDSENVEAVTPLAGVIRGQASYRERIMPRPGSRLVVTLEDVSRADAPAEIVGVDTVAVEGGPPWRFMVGFEPGDIEPRHRYGVRARLLGPDDRLLFTSTEFIPAFDEGRESPIEITMSSVGGEEGSGGR
jgi:putative lipoprotein